MAHFIERETGEGLDNQTQGETTLVKKILGTGHSIESGSNETRTAVTYQEQGGVDSKRGRREQSKGEG